MDSFHAIFKAVHLPLNTVLLTQPVNHYSDIQEILLMTRSSSGSNVNDESGTTLKQFWKDSNIYKAIIGFYHFPWREVTAVTVNGVWENLCLQFVHDFLGFEKADEELIFGNLVTLSEKLKLDLQEGNFIELLAVQRKGLINEDLMELESRKNNGERQGKEKVIEEPERATIQEMARDSLYLRSNFLRHQTQHRMVHNLATAIQNAVQGYHATYDEGKKKKKKSYHPAITGLFFARE